GQRRWWLVLAWLYLMSTPAIANKGVAWLEDQHRPIEDLQPFRDHAVVLLPSGTNRLDAVLGWVNRPAESGWERLLVAVETAREVEGALLIPGGSFTGPRGEPIAVTMKNAVERMGIELAQIEVETQSLNTHENLAFLADRLGEEPFLLVTSATHMPRAMAVADRLDLNAIPQPADFLKSDVIGLRSFLPSISAIITWQVVLHEVVGRLVYRLRGQGA
ncbi:MAG: YdcF family protein, partial [Geminicoccaceae bacterium]